MTDVREIVDLLNKCSTQELDEIADQLKSIREKAFEAENQERIEKLKSTTTIGMWASYQKGDVKNAGKVVLIREDSVQLDVKDAKRRVSCKWIDLTGIHTSEKEAEKAVR